MFSMIPNIYNNNNCSVTGKLKVFWQLEMFDVCTTGDTAHIDTIFKFLPHTRHHGSTWSLHTLASPNGRNVNYNEKQLTGKKFLSCSFCLYMFHKYTYMSYGFPVINFCNPGVHYKMPCIITKSAAHSKSQTYTGWSHMICRYKNSVLFL
jgi:hypothetical protein